MLARMYERWLKDYSAIGYAISQGVPDSLSTAQQNLCAELMNSERAAPFPPRMSTAE